MKKIAFSMATIHLATLTFLVLALHAPAQGPLTPPGAPGATMRSLDQIEPRTAITNLPHEISQPGSYYLAGNLVSAGDGIVVNCDNVTIDLMGFTLQGSGLGYGIKAIPAFGAYKALVVRNGGVTRFTTGVYAQKLEHAVFVDLIVATNTAHGFYFKGQFGPCGDNRIERCTIAKNGECGLLFSSYDALTAPCNNNRIRDCLVSQNATFGIQFDGRSARCDGNIIENTTVSQNGGSGIYLRGNSGACNGNVINGCMVQGNVQSGIELTPDCAKNRIEGNTVSGNGKGLNIHGSGNYVADNMVVGNPDNYDFSQDNQLNLLLGEVPENIDWPASVTFAGTLSCADTTTNGITVNANNVTIDMAGHALVGPGEWAKNGIDQWPSYHNLTIRNGKIVNWFSAASYGIVALGSSGHFIGIQAVSNYNAGIYVGKNCILKDCTAQYNDHKGIDTGDGCILSDCAAAFNKTGIQAGQGCTLAHCAAYDSGSGIEVDFGSLVTDSTAMNNADEGIQVSARCQVTRCMTAYNGTGIHATGRDNRLDENHVAYNSMGIDVDDENNLITRNSARGNTANYDIVIGNKVGTLQTTPVGAGAWDNFDL